MGAPRIPLISPLARLMLNAPMVFIILIAAVLVVVLYGFWMAGELGAGPRLTLGRRREPSREHPEPEIRDASGSRRG